MLLFRDIKIGGVKIRDVRIRDVEIGDVKIGDVRIRDVKIRDVKFGGVKKQKVKLYRLYSWEVSPVIKLRPWAAQGFFVARFRKTADVKAEAWWPKL